MELNESAEEGAAREVMEEACATIAVDGLLAVYSIRHIGQVQLIYRAELVGESVAAGPESEEVRLLTWEEIPWDELAFPSVHWALHQHRESRGRPLGAPYGNPPGQEGRIG